MRLPPLQFAYCCIVGAQSLWALAGVVGRISTSIPINPFVFQFYRNFLAIPLLYGLTRRENVFQISVRKHLPHLFLTAFFIAGSNVIFRIAQTFATASASSGWQPTQQIFTFLLGLSLRLEVLSGRKAVGLIFGFLGAFGLVYFDPRLQTMNSGALKSSTNGEAEGEESPLTALLGHTLLFVNVSFTSAYIVSRQRLIRYCEELGPGKILFWTNMLGSGMALCLAMVSTKVFPEMSLRLFPFLPPDEPQWIAPPEMVATLLFYVLVPTVACHWLIGLAAPHLPPSTFGVFANLQPVLTAIFELVSVGAVGWNPGGKLAMPGWNMLAIAPIGTGMFLVVSGNRAAKTKPTPK